MLNTFNFVQIEDTNISCASFVETLTHTHTAVYLLKIIIIKEHLGDI